MITPPSSNAPPPAGTPVHSRSSTTGFLGGTRDQIINIMSEEMEPFFLGPMPPQQFLSDFLPSDQPSRFSEDVFTNTNVAKYETFIKALRPYLKTIFICDTSHSQDKATNQFPLSLSPDCTVYDAVAHEDLTGHNSSASDVYIEFKGKPEEDAFLTEVPPDSPSFLAVKKKPVSTSGQITSYAALQLESQYRTHVFSVLIVGDYARLIRWDRSGAVVTAPIYYRRQPELFDFFTRYDQAERTVRGYDDSVRNATPSETGKAIAAAPKAFSAPLLIVTVMQRQYVINSPVARPYTPPGRATRTSIAYDLERDCIVFFKDSWRIDCAGIVPEGDVYHILESNRVPNIPHCSASGDVGEHRTQTNRYTNASWAVKSSHSFTPHRHHRLILDHVGEKLDKFRCSKEMVFAIKAALSAHEAAYVTCGILHRDISANNILLTTHSSFSGGLLIDWDLCKFVDLANPCSGSARLSTRTGTWQFMAADLIENPGISQTFVHDIESAFFVLLWMSLIYVKSNWEENRLSSFVHSIFNPPAFGDTGGPSKTMLMQSDNQLSDLVFPGNAPLAELLRSWKKMLAVRHRTRPAETAHAQKLTDAINAVHGEFGIKASSQENSIEAQQSAYDRDMLALKDHRVVLLIIDQALKESWPEVEHAEKQNRAFSRAEIQSLRSSSKRSKQAAEARLGGDDSLSLPKRRRTP